MFTKDSNKDEDNDDNGVEAGDGAETDGRTSEPDGSDVGFENRPDYKKGPQRSAFFVLRRTGRQLPDDGGMDLAAALTYFAVLAIFPGMIALLALVGLLGQ